MPPAREQNSAEAPADALCERVVAFLEARRMAGTSDAVPAFACHAGSGQAELFGLLDHVCARYIVGGVAADDTPVNTPTAWQQLGDAILAWQSEDGWFRSGDEQAHDPLHVTAYAMTALALAARMGGEDVFRQLRPLAAFDAVARRALEGPDALSLLDRIHFWRGSHKAGGIAAIVGTLHEADQAERTLGLADSGAWLAQWAERWRVCADRDGLWRFGGALRAFFYLPYRVRHHEAYAVIGGAAHIYWCYQRLGLPLRSPAAMTDFILAQAGEHAICEAVPYCLDFDRLCLLEMALPHLDDDRAAAAGRLIAVSGDAIRDYLLSRPVADWFASSHRLPGALAALAVSERVGGAPGLAGDHRGLRDILGVGWWL